MSPPPSREVLLTGVTGFLGKVVLFDLLRRREELGVARVHCVIRPTEESPAETRLRREVFDSPALARLPEGWQGFVHALSADLAEPGELADATAALLPDLTHVIHCAASVEFDLPLAEAARANVESALAVQALAQHCPRLARMVSVSTAYVTPHPGDGTPVEECLAPLPRPAAEMLAEIRSGSADEARLLRETGHPNTYTLTKCLAEHLLAEGRGGLPLALVRPSIISASWRRPEPGWIDSPAAFALFVMAIATGRMRAVVARPTARIDVVPCDEVAERVLEAAFEPGASAELDIRHAVAGYAHSISVEACRAGMHAWFQRNPVTTARQGPARVHYLGPPGLRYRFHHWRHHLRRRDAHLVAGRLAETNRRFAYFTRNSFHFLSSVPLARPDFDATVYIGRVCRGVAVHLLDADLSRVSLGGRRHPRAEPLRHGGSLGELERRADWVTVDLLSFEDAMRHRAGSASEGRLVLVPTEDGPWHDPLLELLAASRPDLWKSPPRVARAARAPGLGGPGSELRVHVEHAPPQASDGEGLGRFHLVCAGLSEARPAEAPQPGPDEAASAEGWLQDQA